MTHEELRALDYELAIKAMGFTESEVQACKWCDAGSVAACQEVTREVPAYSEDIAAAWLVLDAMRVRGCEVALEDHTLHDGPNKGWWALFDLPDGGDTGHAIGDTAPLAICLAARKVINKD